MFPGFSTEASFDLADVLGDTATLRTSHVYLCRVLRATLGYDIAAFAYPNGYALVTRAERFDLPGCFPKSPPERWLTGKLFPSFFDPRSWIDLVTGQIADFRVFVLVVSDQAPDPGGRDADWDSAAGWVRRSARDDLPESLPDDRLPPRRCRVFIYHFRSVNGFNHKLQDQHKTPTADQHLRGARLLDYLQKGVP